MNQVKSADLSRMLWNASLFSVSTSMAQGQTLWAVGVNTLRVISDDDYIIVTDRCNTYGPDVKASWKLMSKPALKVATQLLKEETEELFDIDSLDWETIDVHSRKLSLYEADLLAAEAEEEVGSSGVSYFAVDQDALKQLARLRAAGGPHPIDVAAFGEEVGVGSAKLLAYRLGSTVRGVLAPLDRVILKGLYSGDEIWG